MALNISFRCLAMVALAFFLTVQGTFGEIECERLGEDTCAFAVSGEGKRCVLEKRVKRSGEEVYTCRSSEIKTETQKGHIESDECIKACGLDRKSFGISSDSLLESGFMLNLCSPHCFQSCPNIVDLYFNLAAGEGVFLPNLCASESANGRRKMVESKRSDTGAPGPVQHSRQFTTTPPQPSDAVELTQEPAVAPFPQY